MVRARTATDPCLWGEGEGANLLPLRPKMCMCTCIRNILNQFGFECRIKFRFKSWLPQSWLKLKARSETSQQPVYKETLSCFMIIWWKLCFEKSIQKYVYTKPTSATIEWRTGLPQWFTIKNQVIFLGKSTPMGMLEYNYCYIVFYLSVFEVRFAIFIYIAKSFIHSDRTCGWECSLSSQHI